MNVLDFMKPRLTGPRFAEHAIPLEFLKDLAVLQEMLIEVAKWQFLKENPDRQRSPRGFTEGVELKLTGVEDGTAMPVISLFIAGLALLPPQQTYFEKARDAIVSAISSADQDRPIADLPPKTLTYFDRIGRSLRNGEAMEFTIPGHHEPARLTRETRKKLILSSTVQELTEATQVRGTIPEADQDDMSFEIQLADGRKTKAPMAPQHLETIIEAFKGYKSGTHVLLEGVGRFNRSGKLQSFESVEHISILDPLDIPGRLDELRDLRDGWLEGKGVAPPDAGLDWLAEAFGQHFPDDLPLPFLYPTGQGGVQAEWTIDPHEITLEIDLSSHQAAWHYLNMDTNDQESRDLNLDGTDGWNWLSNRLRELGGKA